MNGKFILEGHIPVPCDDILIWGRWFEKANRTVARQIVGHEPDGAEIRVSTVFLGLDHRFGEEGPPLLFETMVFGGPMSDETDHYATWDQAEAGHRAIVERVKAAEFMDKATAHTYARAGEIEAKRLKLTNPKTGSSIEGRRP